MDIDFQASRVLFFAPYGQWIVHEQINAVLAKAMQSRGATVRAIVCDGLYHHHCYPLVNSKAENQIRDCQACARNSEALFTGFNIPFQQMRTHVTQDMSARAEAWIATLDPSKYHLATYNELPVGEWVFPTVCSYLKISSPRFHDPKLQEVLRQYIYYSLTTYWGLEKVFEEYKPTSLVIYSGVGMVHSAVADLAVRKGVRLLCHTLGRERGAFLYTANDAVSAFKPRYHINDLWKNVPLLTEEAERVSNYLSERRQGINHNMPTFYGKSAEEISVRRYLNIPEGKKIFGVFTSSEYEKVYFPEYKDVPSQIEILETLISIFQERDEYLVIRHHPLIGGGSIERPDGDLLTRSYELARRVPKNVRFIMPHEPLTSYTLLWELDACFAPFTTTALEAIAAGVPTLAYQGSPYAPGAEHFLASFDRGTISQAVDALLKEDMQIGREQLSRLYRFMHSFVYRQSMTIKACKSNSSNTLQIEMASFDDLLPGNDPILDHICNHIASETVELYEIPSHERRLMSAEQENAVLDNNLLLIQTHRKPGTIASHTSEEAHHSEKIAHIRIVHQDIGILPYGTEFFASERRGSVVPYLCATQAFSDYRTTLLDLRQVLAMVTQDLVLVGQEFVQYDSGILSVSQQYFESKPELKSVWWGGWIQERDGIRDGLFTKFFPVAHYSELTQRFPQLLSPLSLLAFVIWKRHELECVIDRLLAKSSVTEMCIEMLQITAEASNFCTELPLLVFHGELFEQNRPNSRLNSPHALHII